MNEQIKFYENKLAYEMDSADLKKAIESTNNVVIIDTRKHFAYAEKHIPKAINLPHSEMNLEGTKNLDISKTYICYCDGIGCNGSTKGALKMAELGFKTKELIGGLDWWVRDGHTVEGVESSPINETNCAC